MNTKTTKFLAVFAVLAFAFAALAVAIPAMESDAAITPDYDDVEVPVANVISENKTDITAGNYYVTADVTITVSSDISAAVNIYLAKGVTVTLSGGKESTAIVIYAVDSVTEGTTNYTIDAVDKFYVGKEAAIGTAAVVACDSNGNITVPNATEFTSTAYGMYFTDKATTVAKTTYYVPGYNAGTITLDTANDVFSIMNGSAVVKYTSSTAANSSQFTFVKYVSETAAQITGDASAIATLSGGADNATGTITLNSGTATDGFTEPTSTSGLNWAVMNGALYGSGQSIPLSAALTVYGNVDNLAVTASAANGITLVKATGTIVITDADETVKATRTISFAGASATIAGTGAILNNVTTLTAGSLTMVNGAFIGATTVKAGTTLYIGADATLSLAGGEVALTIEAGAACYISGTVNSTSTTDDAKVYVVDESATKYGTFKARTGATIYDIIFTDDTGADAIKFTYADVDIDAGKQVNGQSGVLKSDVDIDAAQILELVGDLEIINATTITIYGDLYIPAGYKLTIGEGCKLIIKGATAEAAVLGSLIVNAGGVVDIVNNSVFEVDGTFTTNATANKHADLIVEENGNFTIATGGSADLRGYTLITSEAFIIEEGAQLTIAGAISTGAVAGDAYTNIANYGTVVLDGANIMTLTKAANATIDSATNAAHGLGIAMLANGATVNVKEFYFSAETVTNGDPDTYTSSQLKITDAGAKVGTTAIKKNNQILISSASTTVSGLKQGIGGLLVTESLKTATTTTGSTYLKNNMDISGDLEKVNKNSTASTVVITVALTQEADTTSKTYNTLTVGDMTVEEHITVAFSAAPSITFNGDVDVLEGGKLTVAKVTDGKAVVKGEIKFYTEPTANESYFVGAYYKAAAHEFYIMPLGDMIEALSEATTSQDVLIMGANTVGYDLEVPAVIKLKAYRGDGDKITVSDGYTMTVYSGATVAVPVIVKGTLYAEKETDITGTVTADVKVTNEGSAKWTSVANALETATAGDVITITTSNLNIEKNITVPALVELVIPGGTMVTVTDGVIITVDGAMYCDSSSVTGNFDVDDVNKSRLVVNGLVRFSGVTDLFNTYDKYKSAGAYFKDEGYVYVSNLALAVAGGAKAITVYGYVTSNVEVETDKQIITVGDKTNNVTSELRITGLTLGEKSKIIVSQGTVSGVVTGLDSTLMDESVVGLTSYTGTVECWYDASSYWTAVDSIDGVNIMSGVVYLDASSAVTQAATFAVSPDAIFVIENGKTVTLSTTAYIYGTIDVLGSLTIESEKVHVEGIVHSHYDDVKAVGGTVMLEALTLAAGTISADEKATLRVEGDITVGEAPTSVGAGASIIGEIDYIDASNYILVYAGSDVSEMVIEPDAEGFSTASATAFFINEELYMTVYGKATTSVTYNDVLEDITIDIEELDCTKLNAADVSERVKAWGLKSGALIGTDLIASVELGYKSIKISTSWANGLALYIDGVKMLSDNYLLSVGIHSVSAAINPGYACDNMKITFNGIAVPITKEGAIITITVDDTGSVLAVSGDVYIPEPEPVTPEEKSEWTITTILLVILVILIAVMAVIVALRLNRS